MPISPKQKDHYFVKQQEKLTHGIEYMYKVQDLTHADMTWHDDMGRFALQL